MELLRYILDGLVAVLGLSAIVWNYVRQISNFQHKRQGKDGWDSPAPLAGPALVILGGWLLPLNFSWRMFIAFLVDPDTVIVLISLPWLFWALAERDDPSRDT